jgi:hypothetical protein
MIIPDPVIMEQESGRLLEFELGKMEEFKNEETEETETKWVQYKFDQTKPMNVFKFDNN